MARWQGTTTERGYGSPHRAERERRLARYKPGDICAHGGERLTYWPLEVARRYLDLPHTADRSGYLAGLSCRKHNRADGARRRNQMYTRSGRRRTQRPAAKPAPDGDISRCLYCGETAYTPAGETTPPTCTTRICQLAALQAAKLAATGQMTPDQARQHMATRVQQARQARRTQTVTNRR